MNNLGIFEAKPFAEIPDEDWLRFFEVNVLSGVRLSRFYLPTMLGKNWGRIVFISSESALNIPVEMIHYGVTKTAQIALARGLAEMTAGTNVTVNSVLPGPTRSEGVEQFVKDMAKSQGTDDASVEAEFFRSVRPSSLLKRFAKPEEVAAMVVYVCSPLGLGHQRGGASRRWRRCSIDRVNRTNGEQTKECRSRFTVSPGWHLSVDFHIRQRLPEFLQAGVCELGVLETEVRQVLEFPQVVQAGVRDVGLVEEEPLQPLEPPELFQAGVGDLGAAEPEPPQASGTG